MNWKETFYTGKREHPQEKKPASLTALLMPSLLGVAICLVCLCSLTWAWFTATQNSGVQPIQSATATVTASLNDKALGELKVGEPYSLNGTGTLTLHMAGDAQYAYVVIKVGDTEYHGLSYCGWLYDYRQRERRSADPLLGKAGQPAGNGGGERRKHRNGSAGTLRYA